MKWPENVQYMSPTARTITTKLLNQGESINGSPFLFIGKGVFMNNVDLHTHSNKSDGSMSPSELIVLAKDKGLCAIALTDHDTIDGLDEAIAKGDELGIRVIPGVELSCEYQGKDIHIVGLNINHKDSNFKSTLKEFVDSRDLRNRKMCQKLTKAGLPVDYDELIATFSESVITRAHYARYMLSKGYIKSLPEAFERYIGDNSPCYIPREKVTPVQGIQLILNAGGIPVLAHPLLYKMGKERLDNLVTELKEAGLVALEALYSTYTPSDEREMRALATKHGLLISGGSDYHGLAKPGLELGTGYGKLFVPAEVLDNLLSSQATNCN